KALQADCDSSEGLCSPVFKRVLLYPSGVSQPGILGGTVARGQVDGLLRRIRHVIGEQGSPSDVVLIYWLGRGAEKENEKWYLPTYYSRPGKKLSETGMALADLLAADEPTPGARLLLLDVSHSSSEELPVSTLSTAHAGILQYQWSKPGTRIPGLLLALEKAALNRGTV